MSTSTTDSILNRITQATAQWQSSAATAASAAVMGIVRSHRAEPVQEWDALDSVQCNTALQEAVQTGDRHQINIEFSKHLKWATEWAYDDASTMTKLAIERDAVCRDPGLAHPHPDRDDEIRSREAKVQELHQELKAQIDLERRAYSDLLAMQHQGRRPNAAREQVIKRHGEDLEFVKRVAKRFAACDSIERNLQSKLDNLEEHHEAGDPARYSSSEYKEASKILKINATARARVALEVTNHFDHHAQGGVSSESTKPDKYSLKVMSNLAEEKTGWKQIANIDLYTLSRAADMWAILPDITRIGHDVNTTTCLHWKPSEVDSSEHSEEFKSYRSKQAEAFAKKLLQSCDPSLRVKLLATHKHGEGKEKITFTAAKNDGPSLYWVMCQLYRPIGRDYRRKLLEKIYSAASKLSTGNPTTTLTELSGIAIIEKLSERDTQFGVRLEEYRYSPDNPAKKARRTKNGWL